MLQHFDKSVTEYNILVAYNAGIKYVVTGEEIPAVTVKYIKDYRRLKWNIMKSKNSLKKERN